MLTQKLDVLWEKPVGPFDLLSGGFTDEDEEGVEIDVYVRRAPNGKVYIQSATDLTDEIHSLRSHGYIGLALIYEKLMMGCELKGAEDLGDIK